RTLGVIREGHAQLVPVEDRPSQPGDLVGASVSDRVEQEGESGGDQAAEDPGWSDRKDIRVELGAKGVFKEFNDAFNGVRVGDTKQFKVTYPPDHQPEHLAGKTVEYSAEVTGILSKELPDLDDQFAQSVNEDFKTVAELRDALRKEMEHKVEHQTNEEVH